MWLQCRVLLGSREAFFETIIGVTLSVALSLSGGPLNSKIEEGTIHPPKSWLLLTHSQFIIVLTASVPTRDSKP